MALPDPTPLFEGSGEDAHDSPTASGDFSHVSEVLAGSGIPVADSLKQRMLEELVRFVEEDSRHSHASAPRRSA